MTETAKSKTSWLHWLGVVAFVLLLAFAWFFAAAWQFVVPAYIPAYAYLLYALLCSLVFLPFILAGELRRIKAILQFIFVIAVGFLWFSPMDTRQPFLRDLESVEVGMTVTQVDAIMGKYMKGTGWPANPYNWSSSSQSALTEVGSGSTQQTKTNNRGEMEIAGATTYRHSNEAEYNSDWGVVSFKNGRVVNVEFMPD